MSETSPLVSSSTARELERKQHLKQARSAGKSAAMVPTPMANVAKQALSVAEANLRASLEHARKLLQAKDFNEVMQLQSEFLRNQYQAAAEQFKQLANTSSSAASNAANKTST